MKNKKQEKTNQATHKGGHTHKGGRDTGGDVKGEGWKKSRRGGGEGEAVSKKRKKKNQFFFPQRGRGAPLDPSQEERPLLDVGQKT